MNRRGFIKALSGLVGALMLPHIPAAPARVLKPVWATVGDLRLYRYTIGPGGDYSSFDAFQAAHDTTRDSAQRKLATQGPRLGMKAYITSLRAR